jgi:hypothetical protein
MQELSAVPVVCYDLQAISRFFRSCALAIAIQQTTSLEWKSYDDSTALNIAYGILFWKEKPGFADVRTGTQGEIGRRTDEMHLQFLMSFVRKLCEQGPDQAHRYVRAMQNLREQSRAATSDVFRSAQSINNEVIGKTQEAIRDLARIRLASQVGVAVLGAAVGIAFIGATAAGGTAAGAGLTLFGVEAGASATTFAVAGAAHSVSHTVIKNWEEAPRAQIVGVSIELGKEIAEEAGGRLAENALEGALKGTAKSQQVIRSAAGELLKYNERLAQEGLRKAARRKAENIVAARTAQIATQRQAIERFGQTAATAARIGKVIPVVFAGLDIYEAFGDYQSAVQSSR